MNTLNGLIPILYAALQMVARELVGVIPAATRNMTADSAAVGQTVRIPITPPSENSDIVEGVKPTLAGTNIGYRDLKITKMRRAKPIVWTGNEQLEVGGQLNPILVNQYAQAMRSLVNEVEKDVCLEVISGAIEAGNIYGTPGTPVFNGNLADIAQAAKILDDKGAPQMGRQLVINTTAGAALRSLAHLTSVADAGETNMLRRGVFSDLLGFSVRQSAGFQSVSPGTGTGYLVNSAAAAGDTEITIDTGSGTISKGAMITFGAGPHKYVVVEDVASGGTVLKIAGGLKEAVADNTAVTLGAAYLPSAGFTSDAIVLATRLPALPQGGDSAKDTYTVTDDVSGLSIQAALYGEYLQNFIELRLAWGCKATNIDFACALIG
jgi:hypothetical protein